MAKYLISISMHNCYNITFVDIVELTIISQDNLLMKQNWIYLSSRSKGENYLTEI